MKIYLIGLPGSGKSFLGKKLAQEADLPFIDLDKVIEQETGNSIGTIFSEKGETYFRDLEAVALRQQSKVADFVMACGGGAACFHDNIKFMNETGRSIFLNTPIARIVNRLDSSEKQNRPLLAGEYNTLEGRLRTLYETRIAYYRQATFTIDDLCSPEDLLRLLKS